MKVYSVPLGPYGANFYLVIDEDTGKALAVDPGFYCDRLENLLDGRGVKELEYILITHGHMDHMCGASKLREKYGGKIVIGEKDSPALGTYMFVENEPVYENAFIPCKADILADENTVLPFGNTEITTLTASGHSPGGICYITDDMMFCGDVLFKGSIGRYDIQEGGLFYTVNTLKKIAALQKNYRLYTGHGESTTLDDEKKNNAFLRSVK